MKKKRHTKLSVKIDTLTQDNRELRMEVLQLRTALKNIFQATDRVNAAVIDRTSACRYGRNLLN